MGMEREERRPNGNFLRFPPLPNGGCFVKELIGSFAQFDPTAFPHLYLSITVENSRNSLVHTGDEYRKAHKPSSDQPKSATGF